MIADQYMGISAESSTFRIEDQMMSSETEKWRGDLGWDTLLLWLTNDLRVEVATFLYERELKELGHLLATPVSIGSGKKPLASA